MEQHQNLTARLQAAGIAYREQEPLAAHTTFKIGGPAAVFVQPADEAQLCQAVRLCRELAVPCYLLGNGSNILFGDKGYAGAVIMKKPNDVSEFEYFIRQCVKFGLRPFLTAEMPCSGIGRDWRMWILPIYRCPLFRKRRRCWRNFRDRRRNSICQVKKQR